MVHENKLNAQATWDFNHTTWRMYMDNGFAGYYFDLVALDTLNPDTIINSVSYKKISDGSSSSFYFAIRSDNHKLFGIQNNFLPFHEYLLEDFSANVGDTVRNVAIGHSYGFLDTANFYVIAKDSFLMNNHYYKKLKVENLYPTNFGAITYWYENIGSYTGLIEYIGGVALHWLDCYSNNDSIVCPNFLHLNLLNYNSANSMTTSPGYECYNLHIGISELMENKEINISPNPTTGNFTINLNKPYAIIYIEITNVVGEVVRSFDKLRMTPDDKSVTIDMSDVAKGLYFVSVKTNEATQVLKLVKE